jgi:hypothetical protein
MKNDLNVSLSTEVSYQNVYYLSTLLERISGDCNRLWKMTQFVIFRRQFQ